MLITDPKTVVIVLRDTSLALLAVFRSDWLVVLAFIAIVQFLLVFTDISVLRHRFLFLGNFCRFVLL
jgi:hypothetical protein